MNVGSHRSAATACKFIGKAIGAASATFLCLGASGSAQCAVDSDDVDEGESVNSADVIRDVSLVENREIDVQLFAGAGASSETLWHDRDAKVRLDLDHEGMRSVTDPDHTFVLSWRCRPRQAQHELRYLIYPMGGHGGKQWRRQRNFGDLKLNGYQPRSEGRHPDHGSEMSR
jgi:hypothetical protein